MVPQVIRQDHRSLGPRRYHDFSRNPSGSARGDLIVTTLCPSCGERRNSWSSVRDKATDAQPLRNIRPSLNSHSAVDVHVGYPQPVCVSAEIKLPVISSADEHSLTYSIVM